MRFVADSGLWITGPDTAATPLAAVLEVSGAVLSWTIDGPADDAATQITFTDLSRTDWLWRVVGDSGHVTLAGAFGAFGAVGGAPGGPAEPRSIELAGVDIVPGSVRPLRRLAVGHWLRRWWPASRRDGIVGLDRAVLDVEVALLTAGAQGFFADDTLDADVTELLAPHAAALITNLGADDPRIRDLARAGAGLADEVGMDGIGWPELFDALDDSSVIWEMPSGRRDDYALAAGSDARLARSGAAAPIATGVATVGWTAVPPAIFDAAENTVDWSVETAGSAVVAVVRAAIIGPEPASGIAVQMRSGAVSGAGALDADGRATLPLVDAQQLPLSETAAWNQDWAATSLLIGAEVSGVGESPETRDRVRRWARARLDGTADPANQAFLAEVLAAESAY